MSIDQIASDNTSRSSAVAIMLAKAEGLRNEGRLEEARLLADMVLGENPDNPEALLLSGMVEAEVDPALAAERVERHLSICPDSWEGLFWLGVLNIRLQQFAAAVVPLQRLTSLTPDSHYAHRYLGKALEALNRDDEALSAYRRALELSPDNVETLSLIGILHAKQGLFDQAISFFRQALGGNPQYQPAHLCLARALVELNQDEEGYAHYREALRLKPDDVDAMVYLAILLVKTCNMDDAEQLLLQAQRLDSEHPGIYNTLARLRNAQGRGHEAVEALRKAYALDPARREVASNLLFSLNYLADLAPQFVFDEHVRICSELFSSAAAQRTVQAGRKGQNVSAPLRVGYISADFHTHSVTSFFEPVLLHHDRSRFLPFLYYGKGVEDETTVRLRTSAHGWRSTVGLTAEAVAAMIVADGIDILVDLSGHSGMNRLDVFALKPAPLQVSWIGYPHSTGLRQMDYYLSDALCDPAGTTDHLFTEKVYRLPRVFCTYVPPMEFPPIAPVTQAATQSVTFGSFNNFAKTNDELFHLWAAILQRVPGSRLVLKSTALSPGGSTHRRIGALFAGYGIAADRLSVQVVKKSQYDHLEQYSAVDIALDTYPYHGTTTTCEAFWMGVPVVTLAGPCHAARVGVSLLSSVGLTDLIASTPEEYVQTAVRLAHDPQRRIQLRQELRLMMATSPLMDAEGVTREVEAAYQGMFAAYCRSITR